MDVPGKYKIVLDSHAEEFGGAGGLNHDTEFFTNPEGFAGRRNSLMVSCFYFLFIGSHPLSLLSKYFTTISNMCQFSFSPLNCTTHEINVPT